MTVPLEEECPVAPRAAPWAWAPHAAHPAPPTSPRVPDVPHLYQAYVETIVKMVYSAECEVSSMASLKGERRAAGDLEARDPRLHRDMAPGPSRSLLPERRRQSLPALRHLRALRAAQCSAGLLVAPAPRARQRVYILKLFRPASAGQRGLAHRRRGGMGGSFPPS